MAQTRQGYRVAPDATRNIQKLRERVERQVGANEVDFALDRRGSLRGQERLEPGRGELVCHVSRSSKCA